MDCRLPFILMALTLGQFGFSQTCCSGGVPLSNNLGLPNQVQGVVSLALNYDYNNLNTLNAGSDKLRDDSRKRVTNSILLGSSYSLSDSFAVEVLFSWVNQTRNISQFGNQNFTQTSGVGDAVLLAKYALPDIFGAKTVMNIGIGAKAPLGKSDISNEQGILLNADLQPGSGAWDGLVWLSASRGVGFRPSATLSGSFTYRFTGKNKEYLNNTSTYEFGDVVQGNLGYTDQLFMLNTVFSPGLVLKYRKAFTDSINGSELPNTGGEWLFLRPEVITQITPDLNVALRMEIPVYSYVVGTQLTPTVRFSAGMYFAFNIRKTNIINISKQQ